MVEDVVAPGDRQALVDQKVLLVFSKRAQYDNFRLLSIVVEEDSGIAVQQQYAIAQKTPRKQ